MDAGEDDDFGDSLVVEAEVTEAEKEYARILEELRESDGMKLYSDVYTKLYDSYYQLKEEGVAHQENIASLNEKLERYDDTLGGYVAELKDANVTIEKLRADIEEARALADAMHSRELASVESLETIKKTVLRLEKELDARKRAGDDDAGATSAAKEKERFEKEMTRLQSELDVLKQRLNNSQSYIEELEGRNTAGEEQIAKLEEQLEEADNNAVRQTRLIDHMKGETHSLKTEIDHRGHLIANLNDKLSKSDKTLERREKQLKEITTKMETAVHEQESATARAANFRDQLDRMRTDFDKNKQDLLNTAKQLKNCMNDGTRLRNEMAKLTKQEAHSIKKLQLMEQDKAGVERERNDLRQQVSVMERQIMLSNRQAEADRREIENLNREKDILTKTVQKIQAEAQENVQMMNRQQIRQQQLEHELQQSTVQANKQRLALGQLEKDKDRMLEESIALNEKIDELDEEVRLRNAEILEMNKVLREHGIKERKLSVALDSTRAERNMLHKNYTEALDEIQDQKSKIKILSYQVEQLKEDITGKEVGLKACEGTLAKCNKRVELLRAEVLGGQNKLGEAKADITAAKQEEARLNRIVQEGDVAKGKLMKELEGLINERDVVGAQLVRRNDEISLLYEKIRILEITLQRASDLGYNRAQLVRRNDEMSLLYEKIRILEVTLQQGERQYDQRVEDIRLLRLEVLRLRKEKNLLSKGIENMTDLRLEVFNLERELGRERLRVRALEEALETPLNVHRWRKLQGTDPNSVHLTHKLRLTQKKILAQSEVLVLKERELKETRNLYNAVKDTLALQPSPEIKLTLSRTQRVLAQRTSKMKCLVAELSMRERQVTDLRLEMERLNCELSSFKQRYYELKRALDAEEARRLKVMTPMTPQDGVVSVT